MRTLSASLLAMAFAAALVAIGMVGQGAVHAQDFEPDHRLVLYVSDKDAAKMHSALDIAANVSKHYNGRGELVEIRIVAFNQGLHMLRTDTSPVLDRLAAFASGMPNVGFVACGNTLDSMERAEGARPQLADGATVVQTGVAALVDLDEAGWTLVRP